MLKHCIILSGKDFTVLIIEISLSMDLNIHGMNTNNFKKIVI